MCKIYLASHCQYLFAADGKDFTMTDQASSAFRLPTPLSSCTTTPSQSPFHFEAGTIDNDLSSSDESDEN